MNPSQPLEPTDAGVAAATRLWREGTIAPVKPLLAPWRLAHTGALEHAAQVLERGCDALIARWARAEPGLPEVPLEPRVREAALRDARAGRRLLFTRLDVVCPSESPEDFWLLEVQAGDPSAMGYADLLAEAFGAPAELRPSHRRLLEERTGAGRRIAFVVKDGSLIAPDHAALAAHYRAHGWDAQVVDPGALRFDGAALTAAGRPVDAVFRDALDELLDPERAPGGDALLEAHAAGKVVVANPFAAAVADDKAWLEVMSTPGAGWDTGTWAVLQQHVPCTRLVSERTVDWRGERVELLPFVRANREQLVLKPAAGWGGFGVVVGPFVEQAQWEATLALCLAGERHVVQEYRPLPRHQIAFLDAKGQVRRAVAHVVHSLWVHGGRLVGGFVRASADPVVNVHQGGGLGPVSFQPALR